MFAGRLGLLTSQERIRDMRENAAGERRLQAAHTPVTRVTLRYAVAADTALLRALAELDSVAPPGGSALVAEVDGRLRAVLPLDGGEPIADPFFSGGELLELLRLRALQLQGAGARLSG